jgi:tetratricopeptide (TPR) repeat protein
VIVALLAIGGVVWAEEPAVDEYKAAVARGAEAFAAGDWGAARAEFVKAYAIHPEPVLLFNIGSCHRRAGELTAAIAVYEKFVEVARPDDGRVPLAKETIEHLKATLAEHALVAEERARAEAERAKPPEPGLPPVAVIAPRQESPPPPKPRSGRLARRIGVAMLAAGAVALGGGIWQAGVAADAESSLEKLPSGAAWDGEQAMLYRDGRSAATRAQVLGIGGAALAVGGIALYIGGSF